MIADYVIASIEEALERSEGAEVIYIHADGREPCFAAIVRADTPAFARLVDSAVISHDHIEPGMF